MMLMPRASLVSLAVLFLATSVIAQTKIGDEKYLGDNWVGNWGARNAKGSAWLKISRDPDGAIRTEFVLAETGTGTGTKKFTLRAVVENGELVMRTKGSITRLVLSEDGTELRGGYELLAGPYAGEKGSYVFKKSD